MKKIKELITHGLSKRVLMAILVLAAVDMFSMAAPYYLKYVIPHVYTYLNISQSDFDQLNAILGYVVLAMQLPSGWLADKVSGKKLLITSVLMSGVFTVVFALATMDVFKSSQLIVLYLTFVGFGISTTLFLWSPLWKVLSEQSGSKDQGKLYGLQGSYNGFLGLIFITLIGTIATEMANNGNNSLFYALVFIIAGALFVSAWGIHRYVKDTNQKSSLLLSVKHLWANLRKRKQLQDQSDESMRANVKIIFTIRAFLLAFFVLGMYMFQSIFAYYLKSYLSIISGATVVAAVAGFRTYGLRFLISGPWGKWLEKRRSWIFSLTIVLIIGILVAIGFVVAGGIGNHITASMSSGYKWTLHVMFPVLFVLVGVSSWMLVAGRYMQIGEIPHTPSTLGSIIALISFIAFSSDAWFYQMASSWMKAAGHEMTASDVATLGYGKVGGYDQAGLQMLLFTALGIAGLGVMCGATAFMINKMEIKKLHKGSYRWRDESN